MRRLVSLLLLAWTASAAVRSIVVQERTPVDHGYERIVARVTFGAQPKLAANRIIRDLEFAATNAAGEVEFASDLYICGRRTPPNAMAPRCSKSPIAAAKAC